MIRHVPDDDTPGGGHVAAAKRELRRIVRARRRALPDRELRSQRITTHLVELDAVRTARRVLAYDTVPGEVETAPLVAWCLERGVSVAMPEDDVDPAWPDVVVAPGVAFTGDGGRLGQGGGWYDRFLVDIRPGVTSIGLAFETQIVDSLPTEPHDVPLDCVVTENGPRWRRDRDRRAT